jgi:hypothetical protein
MAYVGEPFVDDVFVSYSHGEPDSDGQYRLKQWSTAFARELERELRQFPKGSELSFFIDQHRSPDQGLDPMLPLTDQLERVANAATLVVLASPWYLTSRWCDKERNDWFAKQPALGMSAAGRVAVVHIWHTPDALPPALVDKGGEPPLGFCFYDRERADVRPQPHEWPAATRDSMGPFREQLLELAGRLHARLKMMREQQESRRRALLNVERLGGDGQVVYLHGREAHADSWKRAREALRRSGLKVVPAAPEPVLADPQRLQQIRQHRVQAMSSCDALLLVSADDGWAVDADLVVVGRQDRESARGMPDSRPLPCALIDGIGGSIASEARLETARDLNVQWIDATRDPWTPSVREWLGSVAQAEAAR